MKFLVFLSNYNLHSVHMSTCMYELTNHKPTYLSTLTFTHTYMRTRTHSVCECISTKHGYTYKMCACICVYKTHHMLLFFFPPPLAMCVSCECLRIYCVHMRACMSGYLMLTIWSYIHVYVLNVYMFVYYIHIHMYVHIRVCVCVCKELYINKHPHTDLFWLLSSHMQAVSSGPLVGHCSLKQY